MSKELWGKCQKELIRRAKIGHYKLPRERLPVEFRKTSHPLFGRIICAECGSPYERVTQQYKGRSWKVWRCKKKAGECHNHSIDEGILLEQLGNIDYELVKRIQVSEDGTISVELVKFYQPLITTSGTISQS